MTRNDFNQDDKLKEMEQIFEKKLAKHTKPHMPIVSFLKSDYRPSIPREWHDGVYDYSLLEKFKEKCRECGYFAYWEKPSWAYNSMQYMSVYKTEQECGDYRSAW